MPTKASLRFGSTGSFTVSSQTRAWEHGRLRHKATVPPESHPARHERKRFLTTRTTAKSIRQWRGSGTKQLHTHTHTPSTLRFLVVPMASRLANRTFLVICMDARQARGWTNRPMMDRAPAGFQAWKGRSPALRTKLASREDEASLLSTDRGLSCRCFRDRSRYSKFP